MYACSDSGIYVGHNAKKTAWRSFLKGLGIGLGVHLIMFWMSILLHNFSVINPLLIIAAVFGIFYCLCHKDDKPSDVCSVLLGIAQITVLLTGLLLASVVSDMRYALADSDFYARNFENVIINETLALKYIVTAVIRTVITPLAAFGAYKMRLTPKISDNVKVIVTVVITMVICIPIELVLL